MRPVYIFQKNTVKTIGHFNVGMSHFLVCFDQMSLFVLNFGGLQQFYKVLNFLNKKKSQPIATFLHCGCLLNQINLDYPYSKW